MNRGCKTQGCFRVALKQTLWASRVGWSSGLPLMSVPWLLGSSRRVPSCRIWQLRSMLYWLTGSSKRQKRLGPGLMEMEIYWWTSLPPQSRKIQVKYQSCCTVSPKVTIQWSWMMMILTLRSHPTPTEGATWAQSSTKQARSPNQPGTSRLILSLRESFRSQEPKIMDKDQTRSSSSSMDWLLEATHYRASPLERETTLSTLLISQEISRIIAFSDLALFYLEY